MNELMKGTALTLCWQSQTKKVSSCGVAGGENRTVIHYTFPIKIIKQGLIKGILTVSNISHPFYQNPRKTNGTDLDAWRIKVVVSTEVLSMHLNMAEN